MTRSAVPVDVDGLQFNFPAGWQTAKCDDWTFYRKHFIRLKDGLKSIDLLALSPKMTGDETTPTLWLIEVKDYRRHQRTRPISLDEEMASKVTGTLALLFPAHLNARKPEEQQMAEKALKAKRIRVVLHIEQPRVALAFAPKPINLANVTTALRQRLKAVDPHPKVVDSSSTRVPWTVTP